MYTMAGKASSFLRTGTPQINQHLLKGAICWVNSRWPLPIPSTEGSSSAPCWASSSAASAAGAGATHPGFCGSGTAGPRPTCPATAAPPRAARRRRSRWPTRPRGARTGCPPPAAPGSGTTGWPRSRCSSHWDQLARGQGRETPTQERGVRAMQRSHHHLLHFGASPGQARAAGAG